MATITNVSNLQSKYTYDEQEFEVNTQSNETSTEVVTINFMKVRTGSMDIVMSGSVVNQTLTLTNKSEYEITNISIKDTITGDAVYRDGSVYVDGTSYIGYNPVNGFTLPVSIKAGNSATITYTIVVNDDATNDITTTSQVTYSAGEAKNIIENSNTLRLSLARQEISLKLENDKSAVVKGSRLTYQNVITNMGNVRNIAINFKDDLPDMVEFVEGSVKVDGEARSTANPVSGFVVGNIDAGQSIIVTFDVMVK